MRSIMMRTYTAAAICTAALLAGCADAEDPVTYSAPAENGEATTLQGDDALIAEYANEVQGIPVADAVDPARYRVEIIEGAEQGCEALRAAADMGMISTEGVTSTMTDWIEGVEATMAPDLTAEQARESLRVSAKYRCPEFSSVLRIYWASRPPE